MFASVSVSIFLGPCLITNLRS